MAKINYNERSWAIDTISAINLWASTRNVSIKHAGGENTLRDGKGVLFPDVLLFGDVKKGKILQGWELKMPDTSLEDEELIGNAKQKAKLLSLNSFLLWNVSRAVLYKFNDGDAIVPVMRWNDLSHIKTREQVIQNSEQIETMLHRILNDLNTFITDGTIKSTSVVGVLSSETVADFVQKNVSSYVEALKKKASSDNAFNEEIVIWWRYAKNDYPEENDKYVVLARNNLLFLINKFLFAHILKSYQSEAAIVDTISEETSIELALELFKNISKKCDFWNIFQPQRGEEVITLAVWNDVLSLNNLLKEFDFSKIDRALLHDLIGLTVYKNKRKYTGQFATPEKLAKLATMLTIKDKDLIALDPCCGTGTILKEIYRLKKEHIGPKQSLATLWGSDKFSLPLQMTMFNLADPEALGSVIKVFKNDATELGVGQKVILREPFTGQIVEERLPKISYIVSNLPFVQQGDLKVLNPRVAEINQKIADQLGAKYTLDGRSDLYAYLPFYFWDLLEDDGRASIIVSNSWFGTSWGEKFYQCLCRFFQVKSIAISGQGRWFDNAKVVTSIITFEKRNKPCLNPEKTEQIKFAVTKTALSSYSGESLDEIAAVISTQSNIDEGDVSIRSYSYSNIDKITKLGLNLNSMFANLDWLFDISPKLIRASELFEIGRGERRGWDKLFYPDPPHKIEAEYLKPVLKTPKSISGLVAKPDAVGFCCSEPVKELQRLNHIGALEWIMKFEKLTNEKGELLVKSLARADVNWYTMLPNTLAEIVTSINFGDRLFFARLEQPTFVNQRLIRFTSKPHNKRVRLCHALMNSILGMFYIEAMGFGRGEGVLDISKDKVESSFHIIDPALISDKAEKKILSLFAKLEEREIMPVSIELEQQDRTKFDEAVLQAIECQGLRDKIKLALLSLYKIRIAVNK